jgi:L-2-hydroxyglutarate oxidase
LEKEGGAARHQSGRNSGVIHSGLYYRPGSLKAQYAVEGNRRLIQFCKDHGIAHQICGKLVVATEPDELPRLAQLQERGIANGIAVRRLDLHELRTTQPFVHGLAALHVPSTGIVSYPQVAHAFARLIVQAGGEIRFSAELRACVERGDAVTVETLGESFTARFLINCAGLHSDRVARLMGVRFEARIIPFRGEFYDLRINHDKFPTLPIYPVPHPEFPFLGVHFTPTIEGGMHCGPNAVLALKREGYNKVAFNLRDCSEIVSYAGFWSLARRHWREGLGEVYRSISKAAFTRRLQRLVPSVTPEDLHPSPSGVRAQALARDGRLVDDFVVTSSRRSLHVINAPSPAATAALPLGEAIAGWLPGE